MFARDSHARRTLDGWVRDLLPHLTPDSSEARLLDEITSAEILDLAYLQGAPFESAIAGHAIFPQYVEERERNPVPSGMSVTFPLAVESERPRLVVSLRWGRASELKIGQGGRKRVARPLPAWGPIPDPLLVPTIG